MSPSPVEILKSPHASLLFALSFLWFALTCSCLDLSLEQKTHQRIETLRDLPTRVQLTNDTEVYRPSVGQSKNPAECTTVKSNEQFCPAEGSLPKANKKVYAELKQIWLQFDQQNDCQMERYFAEAGLDHRIAGTISRLIRTFFCKHFFGIVNTVMQSAERMELAEVRTPLAQMTAIKWYISHLLSRLEQRTEVKLSPKLLALLRDLAHNLDEATLKGLKELHRLENGLARKHSIKGYQRAFIRKNVLTLLVDMFFNEQVIRESAGSILLANVTAESCFDASSASHSKGANGDLEVSCAFHFLFNSSAPLKKLIMENFESEEKHNEANNRGKSKGNWIGQIFEDTTRLLGCNHDRSQIREIACKLKADIEENHLCMVADNYDKDCLLKCILDRFPEPYRNKLRQGLKSGGYGALLWGLKSFCRGQSAFVTFSMIDVGVYIQQMYPFNSTNTFSKRAVSPPPLADSQRQQFIIKSTIAYFLRTTEERLDSSIKLWQ